MLPTFLWEDKYSAVVIFLFIFMFLKKQENQQHNRYQKCTKPYFISGLMKLYILRYDAYPLFGKQTQLLI